MRNTFDSALVFVSLCATTSMRFASAQRLLEPSARTFASAPLLVRSGLVSIGTIPPVRWYSEPDWRFDRENIRLEVIATCARHQLLHSRSGRRHEDAMDDAIKQLQRKVDATDEEIREATSTK
jgi:hypothetical protein